MKFYLFDSDYFNKRLYVVGNYSLLRKVIKMDFPLVYFTKYNAFPRHADFIIVNMKNCINFTLNNFDHTCKSIIYTITPLESFIFFKKLRTKDNTIVIHLGNILIVIYLKNTNLSSMMNYTCISYGNERIPFKKLIEILVNKYLKNCKGPIVEEDLDKLNDTIETENIFNYKKLKIGFDKESNFIYLKIKLTIFYQKTKMKTFLQSKI